MSKINCGDAIKDKITGLEGIATSTTEFLYGCRRVQLQPRESKDGKPADAIWIDEAQCDVIKAGVIEGYRPVSAIAAPAGPRPDHVPRRDATRG